MTVNITTVVGKGAPLSATEFDANFTNLKTAVESAQTEVSSIVQDIDSKLGKEEQAADSSLLNGKSTGTALGDIVEQGRPLYVSSTAVNHAVPVSAVARSASAAGFFGFVAEYVMAANFVVTLEGAYYTGSVYVPFSAVLTVWTGTSGAPSFGICEITDAELPFSVYYDTATKKIIFGFTQSTAFRNFNMQVSYLAWTARMQFTAVSEIPSDFVPASIIKKTLTYKGDHGIGETTGQGLSTGFSKTTASNGAIIFRSSGDRTFFLYGLGGTGELRLDTYQGASILYGTRIMIDNQTAQTMSNKSFGTAMMPASNNSIDIGSAGVRFRDIFTVNAVNVLSNAQHKQDVRSMTAQELACAQELAQNISLFRWKDAVAEKGENARIHIGMIAQEVVTIFLKHGLDPYVYGMVCFDSWDAEIVEHPAEYEQIEILAVTEVRLISEAVLDKDGNEQEPAVYEIVELEPARIEQGELITAAWTETVKDAGEAYSLRTEELLYFIMAGQEARMKNIEERLALLE